MKISSGVRHIKAHAAAGRLILLATIATVLAGCANAPPRQTHEVRILDDGGTLRWDVILAPQFAGTWLWHCHVLAHATGPKDVNGFETAAGMIGAIVVEDGTTAMVDLAGHTNH